MDWTQIVITACHTVNITITLCSMDAGVIYWTKTVTAHNTVKITIALCSEDAGLMDWTRIVITACHTVNITTALCSVDAGLMDWPKIAKTFPTLFRSSLHSAWIQWKQEHGAEACIRTRGWPSDVPLSQL